MALPMIAEDIENALNAYDNYNIYDIYERRPRLPKRYIRDAMNPFEWWTEDDFKKRYRFSKHAVMHLILPEINDFLEKPTMRGLPIPPVRQLLLCLRFYSTGSFQIVCGDLDNVSQGTASNIVKRVSALIARLHIRYIKFPSTEADITENRMHFQTLGRVDGRDGIPGVDGAIDCTHIKIVNTPGRGHGEAYRNRKGVFSINVQAVVGCQMKFYDIVARWAGSTHDSRIFQMSRLNIRYMQNRLTGALLGDAGYPALRYLYTPIANPVTPQERLYNRSQMKARNIVERTFGIWKRRFPCLRRGLGNSLQTVSNIIVACAVLHNLAVVGNEDLPEDEAQQEEAEELLVPGDPVPDQPGEGFAVRQALIQAHFL